MGNQKGLKRDFKALEARRFQAISLFDRCLSKAEVARSLGVSAQSVGRWHAAWAREGVKALEAAGRAGRRPRVQPSQRSRFEGLLKAAAHGASGPDDAPWTLARLADAVRSELGLIYHPAHLSRLLRRLGLALPRQRKAFGDSLDSTVTSLYSSRRSRKRGLGVTSECRPTAWSAVG